MSFFNRNNLSPGSSEHPIRPPEHNSFDEQQPLDPETNCFPEVNPVTSENNVTPGKENNKKTLIRQIAKAATHGGAMALTILAVSSAISLSGGNYGATAKDLGKNLKPLTNDAVTTQSSDWTSIRGLWDSDPNAPHDYDSGVITKKGSCTEAAEITYTCQKCGIHKVVSSVNDGHSAGDTVIENKIGSDCMTGGSYDEVVYCTICKAELSRTHVDIPAAGKHTPAEAVKENDTAPTCGKNGSYEKVVYCSVCKAEISRETVSVPTTGEHSPADAVKENDIPATCKTDGSYDSVIYCADCGKELSRENIPVPSTGNHIPGDAVMENITQSTCAKQGSYESVTYCIGCGKELTRETLPLELAPHTSAAAVSENATKATCTKPATHDNVVYCSECGDEISRTTVTDGKALGHTYLDGIDARMTQKYIPTDDDPDGWLPVYTCDRCGEPAIAISYDKATRTLSATVTYEFIVEMRSLGYSQFIWEIDKDYNGDTAFETEIAYTGTTVTYTVPDDWDSYGARIALRSTSDAVSGIYVISRIVPIME